MKKKFVDDCSDCGEPFDLFMLRDIIWHDVLQLSSEKLCLECVNKRMISVRGWGLDEEDFDFNLPINNPI